MTGGPGGPDQEIESPKEVLHMETGRKARRGVDAAFHAAAGEPDLNQDQDHKPGNTANLFLQSVTQCIFNNVGIIWSRALDLYLFCCCEHISQILAASPQLLSGTHSSPNHYFTNNSFPTAQLLKLPTTTNFTNNSASYFPTAPLLKLPTTNFTFYQQLSFLFSNNSAS